MKRLKSEKENRKVTYIVDCPKVHEKEKNKTRKWTNINTVIQESFPEVKKNILRKHVAENIDSEQLISIHNLVKLIDFYR